MISYSTAFELASNYVVMIGKEMMRDGITPIIMEEATREESFGWVFFYQSKQFLETGDFMKALGGNAPIIIDKFSGQLTVTGTVHSIDYYTGAYEKGNSW